MSSFSVIICNFDDLPEAEKEARRTVFHDYTKDWYLVVKNGSEVLRVETDGMEPEDAIFPRALSWIKDALEDAYELGYQDGVMGNNINGSKGLPK